MQGPLGFYLARFMLGTVRLGFPRVILYLTYWFPRRHRARYVGLLALAISLSSVIGSPLSAILLRLDGAFGIKGWQWIYILEASPAALLDILIWVFLSDRPSEAKWLSLAQRQWLEATLDEWSASSWIIPIRLKVDT